MAVKGEENPGLPKMSATARKKALALRKKAAKAEAKAAAKGKVF